MSVDDARHAVNAEKDLLGNGANSRYSSEHRNVGQAKLDAQQILETFEHELSKDDLAKLRAQAEAKMKKQILDNSKGSLSEGEAMDIIRKGEKSMTHEDAEKIIENAEEAMSVDDARRFVNVAKEAILDEQIEQSAKAASSQESSSKQGRVSEVESVKSTSRDSSSPGIASKVEKSIVDEARRIFHRAEKAIGIDETRRTQQVANNVGTIHEHAAHKLTHHVKNQMAVEPPSQIINRASDMMSVADFKVTKPTSSGLTGLASPFSFD
jgi:hypothetical protein